MGKLITVFWRDIPSHIIFKTKSGKFKKQMSPRFEKVVINMGFGTDGNDKKILKSYSDDISMITGQIGEEK